MEKVKELVRGKKMIVVATTVVAIIVVSVIGVYALLGNKTVLEVKKENVIVEYGKSISLEVKEYLTIKDTNLDKKIKVTSTVKNEDNKDYPRIGKYEIIFTYQKEKVTVTVEVKDTVAPTFNTCDSVEFVKGTDFNYGEYIIATDLQEVSYEFKKDSVDVNTVGEYTLKVIATDTSNNKAEKDIKVRVLDTVDTTTNEVTTTVDEKGNVKTTVTEKPKVETPSTPNDNSNTSNGTTTKPITPQKPTPTPQTPSKPNPTPTPTPPPVEKPHQHSSGIINGKVFSTKEECDTWAENYLDSDENFYSSDKKSGYGTMECSCGGWGIYYWY